MFYVSNSEKLSDKAKAKILEPVEKRWESEDASTVGKALRQAQAAMFKHDDRSKEILDKELADLGLNQKPQVLLVNQETQILLACRRTKILDPLFL